jgi:hypothetical protein
MVLFSECSRFSHRSSTRRLACRDFVSFLLLHSPCGRLKLLDSGGQGMHLIPSPLRNFGGALRQFSLEPCPQILLFLLCLDWSSRKASSAESWATRAKSFTPKRSRISARLSSPEPKQRGQVRLSVLVGGRCEKTVLSTSGIYVRLSQFGHKCPGINRLS